MNEMKPKRKTYQVSEETWEKVRAAYLSPLSLSQTARQFNLTIKYVKEHLVAAGIYRGREHLSVHSKRAAKNRAERPGRYAHLK
mgnify:CR=1 FL=1